MDTRYSGTLGKVPPPEIVWTMLAGESLSGHRVILLMVEPLHLAL